MTTATSGGSLRCAFGFEAPDERWIAVPALGAGDDQVWMETSAGQVRRAVGAAWQPEFEPLVLDTLRSALEERTANEDLQILCWPADLPAAVRLSLRVGLSAGMTSWAMHDFRTSSIASASLGPGLQHTSVVALPVDERSVHLVHVHLVFDDGAHSVVLTVQPTFASLFMSLHPALVRVVDSLRIVIDGGAPFRSVHAPDSTVLPSEEWSVS